MPKPISRIDSTGAHVPVVDEQVKLTRMETIACCIKLGQGIDEALQTWAMYDAGTLGPEDIRDLLDTRKVLTEVDKKDFKVRDTVPEPVANNASMNNNRRPTLKQRTTVRDPSTGLVTKIIDA